MYYDLQTVNIVFFQIKFEDISFVHKENMLNFTI